MRVNYNVVDFSPENICFAGFFVDNFHPGLPGVEDGVGLGFGLGFYGFLRRDLGQNDRKRLNEVTRFFFYHRIYDPRTTIALPPRSNSDPGSHCGPSSPPPLRYVPSFFFARIIQHFLPSSTRVKLYPPTLLGALSS